MDSGATQTVAAATAEQIAGVLNLLKNIAEAILGMVGSVVEVVMANPLLLIPIGVVLLRTVISIFRALF